MLCQCSSWSRVILCLSNLQYEKAVSILCSHDPPIVLAKIDASDRKNQDFTQKYGVVGYPTIKLLGNRGSTVQEYLGARDAESIVEYLKKQVGTASTEIKSGEYSPSSLADNNDGGKATVSSAAVDHSSASQALLGGF